MLFNYFYKFILKPLFFQIDPEEVHERMTSFGVLLGKSSLTRSLTRQFFQYKHPALHLNVAGLSFENPLGLAAGFDKNARLYSILPEVGFGFAELGSITGEVCFGNPKPRVFRIPQEKSLLINYGLCNDGSEVIVKRLKNVTFPFPVGISIAKTNNSSLNFKESIMDYRKAYRNLHSFGAYTTINVSCPNTLDGQTFGHPENLKPLLDFLSKEKHSKPIFLKIKPDFLPVQMKEIISIVDTYPWITGYIISNLTLHREGLITGKETLDALSLKGGLSGLPVQKRSNDLIKLTHKHTDKIIIGCGGIFNGQDAYDKFLYGASLLQLITGMIYEGPGVISTINKELVMLLEKNGFKNLQELVDSVAQH